MSKKPILVSAGHNELDCGAVNTKFGWHEQEIATQLRDKTAAILRAQGFTVSEDGEDGDNQPLTRAIELCKSVTARGGVAVEFHLNAAASPAAGGIEVLSLPKHKPLAQDIAAAINSVLNTTLRGGDKGWKPDTSGQHPRLGFCRAGGLIIETCFISNTVETRKLLDNLDAAAQVVAAAIAKHATKGEPVAANTYTVAAGDSLTKIAEKFGTSVAELGRLNKLRDANKIEVGQKLIVKE